jgi:hypothetical protein
MMHTVVCTIPALGVGQPWTDRLQRPLSFDVERLHRVRVLTVANRPVAVVREIWFKNYVMAERQKWAQVATEVKIQPE